MTEELMAVLTIGFAGAFLLWIARRQLRSGVAWGPLRRIWKPITRANAPFAFWLAVGINLTVGAFLVLSTLGLFLP